MGSPHNLSQTMGPNSVLLHLNNSHRATRFITSSPRYLQSNGLVERGVGTVKRLLQNSHDPHIALLSFRATPLPWCSLSPAELLFGRRINTDLPQSDHQLTPQWPYLGDFRRADEEFKAKQAFYFNNRHRMRPLPPLAVGDPLLVRTGTDRCQEGLLDSQ